MNINRSKTLNNLQFYPEAKQKSQIFLHHTAGLNAQGAIDWWNQTPEHVGTAYVIERDGTIFEVFPPDRWAYHVGLKNDDDFVEKNSVGIELVSGGQLIKEGQKFMFYPLYPNKAGGREIKKEEVWEMPQEWRGFKYFHKYTAEQIKATISLVKYLMETFKISIQPNFSQFWEYNEDVYQKHSSGIWSHSTARKDKVDIIPHPEFIVPFLKEVGNISIESPKPKLKVEEAVKSESIPSPKSQTGKKK